MSLSPNPALSRPLHLAVVSYLNSRPYVEGLRREFAPSELALLERVPRACADAFASGEADIALLPVGALMAYDRISLLADFCIGAAQTVDSVFLVAHRPLSQVARIYCDSHSLTSNGLVELLAAHHWQIDVEFSDEPIALDALPADAAAVVIGDRALAVEMASMQRFAVVIDLAAAWHEWTGLPFAFAVWALRPERVSEATLARLYHALADGLTRREASARAWAREQGHDLAGQELAQRYVTQAIDYRLDALKLEAISRYLSALAQLRGRRAPALTLIPSPLSPSLALV